VLIGAAPDDVESSGTFILAILEAWRQTAIVTFCVRKVVAINMDPRLSVSFVTAFGLATELGLPVSQQMACCVRGWNRRPSSAP
jgi:hypothetical protein